MNVNKLFWFVLVSIILIGITQIWNDQLILQRFLVLLIGLLISSYLWALFSLRGLEVSRTSKSRREELGQIIEERIEINNHSRFPKMWVEIDDRSLLPGKSASRIVTSIKPQQTRVFQHLRRLSQRGEFKLGPTVLKSGDPFGVFTYSIEFEAKKSILVLPSTFFIESLRSTPGQMSGRRAIRKSSHDTTPYPSGVREYNAGDSLSRVHWKTTAKKERLMVKEFEEEPQSDVWIFLDADQAYHFHENTIQQADDEVSYNNFSNQSRFVLPKDSFEFEVAISNSIADYFIRDARAVGLACMTNKTIILTPEKGDRQFSKLMDTFAYVQPEGVLSISALVQSQYAGLTKGASVYLITASNSDELIYTVDQLNRRGNKVVMILIDGATFGGNISSNLIKNSLDLRGIPNVLVKSDDDIVSVIEEAIGINEIKRM